MNSLCSVHSHGFRNAKAVVAVASVMSPFTTYNGSFTNTSVMTLAIGTYATLGGDTASVAVNMLQTKMLFCSKSKGLFYCTYSGGSWSSPTQLSTTGFTDCVLSQDGTRGVAVNYWSATASYFINWSAATPTISVLDSNTRTLAGLSMTPDGNTVVVSNINVGIFYTTWNGTSYPAFTQIRSQDGHLTSCVSPDGKTIIYADGFTQRYLTYNGTAWSSPLSTGLVGDTRGMCFLGGGTSGTPCYWLVSVCSTWAGGPTGPDLWLFSYNNSTHQLSGGVDLIANLPCFANTWALTPCGAKGNIVYFANIPASGTTFTINAVTLSVT